MIFLVENVERILPVVSFVSTVSGILAIGLLMVTAILWTTQPFQVSSAPKNSTQPSPKTPADKKPVFIAVRNTDTPQMQKLNSLMSVGFVLTSGWEGTNHNGG